MAAPAHPLTSAKKGTHVKTFKYSARRISSGDVQDGVIEANSQDEAIAQLKEDGLIVSKFEEVQTAHDIDLRIGGRRAKEKSLAIMCNQFAIVLKAGLPIVRTIELVADQTDDKTLKAILTDVADDVAAGYSLADSFEKHGSGLPVTFIETVHAGENSGNLDTVFERLSNYYEKSAKSKGKVKSAMIYPSFVMGVAVIVVAVIMVFAVPTFKSTFESMGADLPLPTKLMISTSDFMTRYFLVIVGVIAAIVVGIKLLKRYNENFRIAWSRLGTRVPVIGKIIVMSASSQYAGTMSIMMTAGLPVVQAVDVAAKTISNYYMAHALASVEPAVESGKPLAESIARTEAFPHLVSEMTGVGEDTGTLESTLEVISEYYDNEVETLTARAIGLLEPITIVILAVIVCVILLAVYLPMFSIYGSYNNAA